MSRLKQIEMGSSVEFEGGWYSVEKIITIPKIAGSMQFLRLKNFDNPVPMTDVKLIKQNAS